MAVIKRSTKGAPLTHAEMDGNMDEILLRAMKSGTVLTDTLAINTDAFVVNAAKRVLVGSGNDDGSNKFQVNGTLRANTLISTNGSAIALFGANSGNNSTVTDSTVKATRIGMPHYLSAEEPVGMLVAISTSTDNDLKIGGGTSTMNAPTTLSFYTGATNTTTTGTERMRITNTGNVLISTPTDDGVNKLQVNGGIAINPATTIIAPSAGGAGVLPNSPSGYATIYIGGVARKIAYY